MPRIDFAIFVSMLLWPLYSQRKYARDIYFLITYMLATPFAILSADEHGALSEAEALSKLPPDMEHYRALA